LHRQRVMRCMGCGHLEFRGLQQFCRVCNAKFGAWQVGRRRKNDADAHGLACSFVNCDLLRGDFCVATIAPVAWCCIRRCCSPCPVRKGDEATIASSFCVKIFFCSELKSKEPIQKYQPFLSSDLRCQNIQVNFTPFANAL
jgi:hypothetical protein